jgi:hypothetical protein
LIRRKKKAVVVKKPDFEPLALVAIHTKSQLKPNTRASVVEVTKPADKKLLQELLLNTSTGLAQGLFFIGTPGLEPLSKSVTYVFHSADASLKLLNLLLAQEVAACQTENTLFRLDSAVTKCYASFVKLSCLEYLWKILAGVVTELVVAVEGQANIKSSDEDHQIVLSVSLELDPTKTQSTDNLDVNKLQLQLFTQKILHMIFSTGRKMPRYKVVCFEISKLYRELRIFLAHVYRNVRQKFPNAAYQSVGAFAFLRMICPAITAPQLYGVSENPVGKESQRYLVLISKIVTNIANFNGGLKEEYLDGMKDFILENQQKVRGFIDAVLVSSFLVIDDLVVGKFY